MIVGKISGLIDQYYAACRLHDSRNKHKLAVNEEIEEGSIKLEEK